MSRSSRAHALPLLLAALLLSPAGAIGAPPPADKETARALAIEGREKLAAKDYDGARKAFKAAHEIMGAPTTGLELANALDGVGQLIEARALALEVTRMPPKPGEPPAFAEARAAAGELTEKLAARIPSVVITVKGVDTKITPSVTLDGDALSPSLLKIPREINPGQHTIAASAPGYAKEQRVVGVKERQTVPVEISLSPLAAPKPAPVQRIAGFAMGAAGIVGVGVGVIFAAIAISKNSDSKASGHCDAQSFCDPIGKELRDGSFHAARISTVAFIDGVAALAGGAFLVLTAPSRGSSAAVAIGPGSVSMAGRW